MGGSATDIFISYKAEDRARLKPLVAALEAEGFSIWWDAHIGGGTNWRRDIEEHLDAAKCVLVAWTKRSVGPDGEFVRDEAGEARRRGTYLPVRFDAVELPLGFREVQAISLKGWRGDLADPRFAALKKAITERITGEPAAQDQLSRGGETLTRRTLIGGGAVAAVAIAGVGGWKLLKSSSGSGPPSIAVLPFANLSGDPAQAYFSDGIADEIRSALARLGGLVVIGSTSSEAVRNDDAKTAAAKLGVATILTGSVRQSPSTIRISAELIDGRTGADRWTEDYDRSPGDSIKIQTDIAQNVATALEGALGLAARAAMTLGGTSDSVAQRLVLQSRKLGRESYTIDSLRQRVALAEAAIARDPRYADAYIDKANSMTDLSSIEPSSSDAGNDLAQADVAAKRAIALAPTLGSAHVALANVAGTRLDLGASLRETRISLALSPNDPVVLEYGSLNLGYFDAAEGLRIVERGIARDPLNARLYRFKSELLVASRAYAQAIQAGRQALQLAPNLQSAHILTGDALLLLGHAEEAKAEYEMIGADDPFRGLRLALTVARTGDRAGAEKQLALLQKRLGGTASYQFGEIYAQLDERDRAFAAFDDAVRVKDSGIRYLKLDPFLDPIRGDPRYHALLKRLDFP